MTSLYVHPYYVDMNITLSVDRQLVERARRVAESMGKSLNQIIRDHLAYLAGEGTMDAELKELKQLSLESGGRSKGWTFDRGALHERS